MPRTNEYIEYLMYNVKHGGISEEVAADLIAREDWKAVSELMDYADRQAEAQREIYGEEYGTAGEVAAPR